MSEVEHEKDYKCIKIITIIIIYTIIGIVALFTFCVSKVKADSLYGTYLNSYFPNGNQSGHFTCNEIPCTLTASPNSSNLYTNNTFTIRVHTGYNASWVYQTGLTYKIKYQYYNFTLNLDTSNIKVYYVNSSGTKTRIYNECTTTSNQTVRKVSIGALTGQEKTFDINTYCSNMKVTSDQTDWLIEIPLASVQGSGLYGQMTLEAWRFTKSQVQNSTLDTDKITSNANKNTDSIINNNNFNTQSIINSNETNTERIIESNNNTQESIDNLNDSITDSSVDNPSSALNGMNNYFGSNGVISDLLLLPVRLYQSIVNTIDGTCSAFNLGTLFNHQLTMPCINLSTRLGNSLYGVIDVLISGFFILTIRKKFVDIFNHFTSLNMGGNELE